MESVKKQFEFADWVASFIASITTRQQDMVVHCLPQKSHLMQHGDGNGASSAR